MRHYCILPAIFSISFPIPGGHPPGVARFLHRIAETKKSKALVFKKISPAASVGTGEALAIYVKEFEVIAMLKIRKVL